MFDKKYVILKKEADFINSDNGNIIDNGEYTVVEISEHEDICDVTKKLAYDLLEKNVPSLCIIDMLLHICSNAVILPNISITTTIGDSVISATSKDGKSIKWLSQKTKDYIIYKIEEIPENN